MQQMPFQKFICPSCGEEMYTRQFQAYCSEEGCNWAEMEPADELTLQPTPKQSSAFWPGLITIFAIAYLFFLFKYLYEFYLWWLS